MARLRRAEQFHPSEIAVVHVMCRVVRRCYLMGTDLVSGKCYNHRKLWIEQQLERAAASFGIDLIAFSLMSNHLHLVLRSRPDVVQTWDDTEVARRWLMLCPVRKNVDGSAKEPTLCELNSIRTDPDRVLELRQRLSDISWWVRLMCQRIAKRANAEDGLEGHFWQGRYKAVRLLDEQAILACAAYVDLNPIRAALAETIEESQFTSAQRRVRSFVQPRQVERSGRGTDPHRPDACLAPVQLDEIRDALGTRPSASSVRCSDKGFCNLSEGEYLQLLDWTARQLKPAQRGSTPKKTPPILKRLQLEPSTWCALVGDFGSIFRAVAGMPHRVNEHRSHRKALSRCPFSFAPCRRIWSISTAFSHRRARSPSCPRCSRLSPSTQSLKSIEKPAPTTHLTRRLSALVNKSVPSKIGDLA
jgi:hypothetical protein